MSDKQHRWTLEEKLEVVRAHQRGVYVKDLQSLFHLSCDTIYRWVRRYEKDGVVGLEAKPPARRRELAPKTAAAQEFVHKLPRSRPIGVGTAQGLLYRFGFLDLARETVRKILRRDARPPIAPRTHPRHKPAKFKRFEAARPNQLWQTDILSLMIRGQYRVYVIAFMDDRSRFIVGWGVFRFQTAANVIEVLRAAIEKYGPPREILSDNGRQYYTWRGTGQFDKLLLKLGIRHIRSRPHHPQTLGKVEAFWRTLLGECLASVPLSSFEEVEGKIKAYVEKYNYRRTHEGLGKMTPADCFYGVEGQVQQLIQENGARVARQGTRAPDYKPPTYLVGNLGGKELRVVAKDAEVLLSEGPKEEGQHEEAGGAASGERRKAHDEGAPGVGPAGPREGAGGDDAVRGGGGVPKPVLPLAQAGPGGAPGGAGDQEAGPEGEGGPAKPEGDPGAPGAASGA